MAKNVMDQLVVNGRVHRGLLGVTVQGITGDLAAGLGLPKAEGAVVSDVTPGSAAAKAGLKVGDVLSGSWGYDQTNVEFWEVTKLVGKRMVEIRELCCESIETGFMSGNAVPLPGQYTKKEARRVMVNENDGVKLFSWGCYLSKVEPIKVGGKAVGYRSASWTAYA